MFDKINKITVKINNNGTGILWLSEDNQIYLFSAAHNFKNCDENINFTYADGNKAYTIHKNKIVIPNEFEKESNSNKGNRDIAIIKLQNDADLESYIELESYINQYSKLFKYKYINGSQLKNYTKGKFLTVGFNGSEGYRESRNSYNISYKDAGDSGAHIHNYFMDATSNIGSDGVSTNIFNGMSGAGVFYCDNDQILLCGIYSGNNDEVGEKNIIYTSSSDSLVEILKNQSYSNTNNFYFTRTNFDTSKNGHNIPRIDILNQEFSDQFIGFKTGFLKRDVFEECIQEINKGNSLVIHGKAGVGKSGCVHHIVNYCKENDIVYLALKLDKRAPDDTPKRWGKKLGLQGSISECINNISQGKKAVIVLDQLDALRWTQAHSIEALTTCKDTIYEAQEINKGRYEKISIVFVVRTFDLENDNDIGGLFQQKYSDLVFKKCAINELSDIEVNEIVGSQYSQLPNKLQNVLKIPNNIYIWQHLDPGLNYDNCSKTSHLIDTWWKQIVNRYITIFNDDKDLNNAKIDIVKLFESKNKLSLSSLSKSVVLNICTNKILDFLCENEFLVVSGNKVSFAHQSIIDYFLSESMVIKYHNDNDIIDIVGDKEVQTPVRRYQVQMCMQQLLEDDTGCFIDFGNKLLDSENIRFSYKFLFFELLNQIEKIDEVVEEFIIINCEDAAWGKYIINNVIMGKINYVTILLDNDVLEYWYDDLEKKNIVFNILRTVIGKFTKDIVDFIETRILLNKEDDIQFMNVLYFLNENVEEDVFALKMKLYKKHYDVVYDYYVDFKSLFNNNYKIALEYLKFLLEIKEKGINKKNKKIINEIDDFIEIECDDIEEKSEYIINYLIPSIPEKQYEEIQYTGWIAHTYNSNTLERGCVKLIKRATVILAKKFPERFFEIFDNYMGENYALFNEIILTAFCELPNNYADKVINYLCKNFENNIFDYTSENVDKLHLTKIIVKKFAPSCSDNNYILLENAIYYYQGDIATRYGYTLEYSKTHRILYRSFWGELQYELLNELPIERLSNKAIQLVQVLNRKFPYGTSYYKKSRGESFTSVSPIKEKVLSEKNWKEILTSRNIKETRYFARKKDGTKYIDNSMGTFASEFCNVAKENPEKYIKLVTSIEEDIDPLFIANFLSTIAYSEKLETINIVLLEDLIKNIKYDYSSYVGKNICRIVENKETTNWSEDIINIVYDIAKNHTDPIYCERTKNETINNLQGDASHCTRGVAIFTIMKLIKRNHLYFEKFREFLESACNDKSAEVRCAVFMCISNIKLIDIEWSEKLQLQLLANDNRLLNFLYVNDIICLMNRDSVLVINSINNNYNSEDVDLKNGTIKRLVALALLNIEFTDVFNKYKSMDEEELDTILISLLAYFDDDVYRDIVSKNIIEISNYWSKGQGLTRLFYDDRINIARDKELILAVMKTKLGTDSLSAFISFLKRSTKPISDFSEIIFSACRYNIDNAMDDTHTSKYLIIREISKLILYLYDESSEGKTEKSKTICGQCLNLWDEMFEKQLGDVREISRKIMQL